MLKRLAPAAVCVAMMTAGVTGVASPSQTEVSKNFALVDINKVAQFVTESKDFKSKEESLASEWKKISEARTELQKKTAAFAKLTDEKKKTSVNQAKQKELTLAGQTQLEKEKSFQEKYFKQKEESMKTVTAEVKKTISKYAKNKGYSLVLNNTQVWYSGSAEDITQAIIKEFKNNA